MSSKNESGQDLAIRYLEFLSYYEKELLVNPKTEKEVVATKSSAPMITPNENVSGLDPHPAYGPYPSLKVMQAAIQGCLKCELGPGRNKFVFGVGPQDARVVFIGEGPGAEEDKRGEPFVGRAGALLNKLIEHIGWRREEVYIANMVKCRPPGNRDPHPDELKTCQPFLLEQLRLIGPQWLVAVGRISGQTLLETTAPLRQLRGRIHKFQGINLWVTYHPAALLRNENLMPDAHQDFETLKKMVESGPALPSDS
jgi:uracil-DNA glycosylase